MRHPGSRRACGHETCQPPKLRGQPRGDGSIVDYREVENSATPKALEGQAPFRDYTTWYRVTGDLSGDQGCRSSSCMAAPAAPTTMSTRLKGFAAHGPRGRPLRSARQRAVHPSARQGRRLLDRRAVPGRARQPHPPSRHRAAATTCSANPGAACWAPSMRSPGRRLRSLVIANSPASMELWVQEANRLREALPPAVQATLLAHEAAGTTSSPEYQAAVRVFYDRHVCRVEPVAGRGRPHLRRDRGRSRPSTSP